MGLSHTRTVLSVLISKANLSDIVQWTVDSSVSVCRAMMAVEVRNSWCVPADTGDYYDHLRPIGSPQGFSQSVGSASLQVDRQAKWS